MQVEQPSQEKEQQIIKNNDGFVSIQSQVDNFFCRRTSIESKTVCKKVTQPQPFKFHASSRPNQNDQSMQIIQTVPKFQAKQMPRYKFFLVKKSAAQLTVPKTFNLATEKRNELKQNQSMQIQSVDSEEILNRSFKAQPMPNYNELASEFVNKNIQIKKPTVPRVIKFHTDSRLQMKKQAQQQTNSEEKKCTFKARPVPKNKVFQVKKKICKPVILSNQKAKVPMNLEERSAKRKAFEDRVNENKMFLYILKNVINFFLFQRKEEETLEMQEKGKLNSLRKTLDFKAAPVKRYKQVEIHHSAQKPTVAIEPKLSTDERAQKMKFTLPSQSKENQDPIMMLQE